MEESDNTAPSICATAPLSLLLLLSGTPATTEKRANTWSSMIEQLHVQQFILVCLQSRILKTKPTWWLHDLRTQNIFGRTFSSVSDSPPLLFTCTDKLGFSSHGCIVKHLTLVQSCTLWIIAVFTSHHSIEMSKFWGENWCFSYPLPVLVVKNPRVFLW